MTSWVRTDGEQQSSANQSDNILEMEYSSPRDLNNYLLGNLDK